jgi:hypothetical protein
LDHLLPQCAASGGTELCDPVTDGTLCLGVTVLADLGEKLDTDSAVAVAAVEDIVAPFDQRAVAEDLVVILLVRRVP